MIIADLHIHSKHAQATSKNLDLTTLEKYARIKGTHLLGTGDFTHPKWIQELKQDLTEDETGILRTKTNFPFILQTEISLVYTQNGKGRRIHHLITAPNFEVVDQITEFLLTKGRVDYDGRPIFGMSSIELVEKIKEISKDCMLIPAHVWTPYFGLLGSKTGFDSIEECFEDQTKNIHAYETGLSSDPKMNWRVSKLNKYTQLSFSDLHSYWPWRMTREATVFETKYNYKEIMKAIKDNKIKETIEVDPNYGKYHYDGHKACNVVMSPEETKQHNGICTKCSKPVTIGVQNRVNELTDKEEGYKPKNGADYKTLIPLTELISAVIQKGVNTQKAWEIYNTLIKNFENEFNILLNVSKEELEKVTTNRNNTKK